jgi:hypothetical protein
MVDKIDETNKTDKTKLNLNASPKDDAPTYDG